MATEKTIEVMATELPEEFLVKAEEAYEEEDNTTFGKGGKRRHKGRAARRKQTANYKSRQKDRANTAAKNAAKREAKANDSNGFRVERASGEKMPVPAEAMRAEALSKMAGKYKTPREKMLEKKAELQRVADQWKAKADEAMEQVCAFEVSKDRYNISKLEELRRKANDLKFNADEAQKAADDVIVDVD